MDAEPRTLAGKLLELDYRMVEWWSMTGTTFSLAQVVKRSDALALIEEAEARADTGLDAAWKAAEAALPKGEAWDGQTLELGGWHCGNNDGTGCDHDYTALVRGANDENLIEGRGRTPAEALQALAARLGEGRE